MKNTTIQGYETCDIGIAAFLLAHQMPMSGISRERDSLVFIFSQSQQSRQLVEQFMCGNDLVSAKSLLAAGKHLRRLVRENL